MRTLKGEYGARTSRSDPSDPLSSVLYVAAPIQYENHIIGVISVSKSEESLSVYGSKFKDKYVFISNWTQFKDDRFDENNKLITPKNMKNITARCNYFRMNIRDVDRQSGYIGSSGDDSVIMAYAALLDAKDNWEKLVIYSMLHMGDTDTTGCIAASWYGALYGFNDVSQHLIDNLEYIDDLEKLGSKFYSKFGSK